MSASFDLLIDPHATDFAADLRLLDAHGSQLAYRRTDFSTVSASHRDGLFNLRHHLELLVDSSQQAVGIAEVGGCIAQEVLGEELFGRLASSWEPRTLRILLPTTADNPLARQLARIPWEIARRAPDQPTLAEQNLHIRVVGTRSEPAPPPLGLAPGKSLRLLFVFAEARGSRPLEARRERRELLQLFKTRIYPQYRVEAHFLSHGVTRERLEAQVRQNGGYHVVHWSGHGGQNQLELTCPGGGADYLTGTELLDLFIRAGGRLPQLIFLSACNSGEVLRVQDWQDLLAVAQGRQPVLAAPAPVVEAAPAATQLGYTGTAHALLAGGVPAVVAMRYAVGDAYARELALQFYEALLAYDERQPVETALLTARQQLARQLDQSRFVPCDHATPVLYGAGQPDLNPPPGRSPALSAHSPRLGLPVPELTLAGHQHFVGRTWELAGLGTDFIGNGAGVKPVAVITGLGGMGKTALTAEALDLWEQRFKYVLLYQAKPGALSLELTLRDLHLKLVEESSIYHDYVQAHPTAAIHREPTDTFTGEARLERLTRNLMRALQDEPVLLVLDNFEANLQPTPAPGPGAPRWACQDPAWDRCLAQLAAGLVDSPSRVLITCRWPLAALADGASYAVPLGPLPAREAALYVRSHPKLLDLALHPGPQESGLVERLVNASRLHPLLLDRLARLATGGPALRPQLLDALAALETTHDYSQLPSLFTVERGNQQETAYLQDALASSLDLLIEQASPDVRRLLWMLSIANEPVAFGLLDAVWRGETPEYRRQRQLKKALADVSKFSPRVQEWLRSLSLERRMAVESLQLLPNRPAIRPLLDYLLAVGLATTERTGLEDDTLNLTCHELVRERIQDSPTAQAQEISDQTADDIRLAYAEWLEYTCAELTHKNMALAIEAGRQAIVYYVQAHAYKRLGSLVSRVVTSGANTKVLESLLPSLEQAVREAPTGIREWTACGHLADALLNAGRVEDSLPYYKYASMLARVAAEQDDEVTEQAWTDLGWLTNNWAIALRDGGQLGAARQQLLVSAEAKKKAGSSTVSIIGTEIEVLRLDVLQGQAKSVRPQVEQRLTQLQTWWQQQQAGQFVPDAPDVEELARALIAALDVARGTDVAEKDWNSSLGRNNDILEIERILARSAEDMAATRLNRVQDLEKLGHFEEAQAELEKCLTVFVNSPRDRASVYSSLASLFETQRDTTQAVIQEHRALAIREQLSYPTERAISHGNLALYLGHSTQPAKIAEAAKHQLTATIYLIITEAGRDLQTAFHNYVVDFRRAQVTDTPPAIPHVAELLDDPAFRPLAEWLGERQIDPAELQVVVDKFLEQARQFAANNPVDNT